MQLSSIGPLKGPQPFAQFSAHVDGVLTFSMNLPGDVASFLDADKAKEKLEDFV